MMKRRRWLWIGGALAGLIIVFVLVGSWLMGEPLRRYVERELNRHLNVWSGEHVYPSPLHLEGQIFDSGRVVIDGHANFLAEPHVALQAQVALERIDLAYVRPIL